ncbi:hypothetical protein D9M72_401980 [compost metagenome]
MIVPGAGIDYEIGKITRADPVVAAAEREAHFFKSAQHGTGRNLASGEIDGEIARALHLADIEPVLARTAVDLGGVECGDDLVTAVAAK